MDKRAALVVVLQVAGLVLVSVAAFTVSAALGLTVAGLSLLALGVAVELR